MSLETWAFFVVAEGVLCFTPGPAVLMVLSLGLTGRPGAAVQASVGVTVANAFYFALAATGIGAVLAASWELFAVIKWAGTAYLCWIGVGMLLWRSRPAESEPADEDRSRRHGALLHGVIAQGANPKALLFFAAFLPQFVDPRQALAPQIAILAVTSIVIELCALVTYAALARRARRLATHAVARTWLQRAGGCLMIGAGAGLATLDRP